MAQRLPEVRVVPEGLVYRDDILSPAEEQGLLAEVQDLDYQSFVMRGQAAKRTVRSYGWSYSFETSQLTATDPLPEPLLELRERVAGLADVPPDAFEQALVTRYPPGATIGWHRDAPPFGPTIIGVSLGSPSRMRFQRKLGGYRYLHDQQLEPRSAYVLSGPARSAWEHTIPATKDLRFSVTFRTIRESRRPAT
jgi:alkylated DNA repair protein (DNA oxidative demethylase)